MAENFRHSLLLSAALHSILNNKMPGQANAFSPLTSLCIPKKKGGPPHGQPCIQKTESGISYS